MAEDEPTCLGGRSMTLSEALGVERGDVVALVGGGGKTTAMYRLAAELAARDGRVIVTTTTHILPPQPGEAAETILSDDLETLLTAACAALERHPIVAVARGLHPDGRLVGVDPGWMVELRDRCPITNLLVEADGSAGRPFKAPAPHEPVIPPCTDLVVPVVGLSVLGRPLSSENVHRPERVAALTGVRLGDPVTAEVVAGVLTHPDGGARGVPRGARLVPLLNQADDDARLEDGRRIASVLIRCGASRIVIAAARDAMPVREVVLIESEAGVLSRDAQVAGVVLAAGEGRRMGRLKLGLRLEGKSLLRRVVETALAAKLDDVVVVLGHRAAELEGELPVDNRVRVVYNPRYAEGQSTSVKAGVEALDARTGAAIFLLGDQPTVRAEVVDALVELFRSAHPPLAQPRYRGVPGHPVLFARSLFPELMEVTGDMGGREVLARRREDVAMVEFDLEPPGDIDTMDDYLRFSDTVPEG